jgi:putative glycosyltransferase
VIRRLFFGELLQGWPSLIVSIWFLGGVTLLALGTIGVYLAKVFSEVKQRPNTTIRQVYEATRKT